MRSAEQNQQKILDFIRREIETKDIPLLCGKFARP